jgi:hypothetical protein
MAGAERPSRFDGGTIRPMLRSWTTARPGGSRGWILAVLLLLGGGCGHGEDPAPDGDAGDAGTPARPASGDTTGEGAPGSPPPESAALFADVTGETGLDFFYWNGMSGEHYMPENMGGGGALADLDGDGDLDLFLVQGRMLGPGKSPADAATPPPTPLADRLFRNDLAPGGVPRFTDVTAEAGLADLADPAGYGMGAAAGDYDNDGRVDLYLTRFGPNRLLRNRGDGGGVRFEDVTAEAGVDDPRWSVPALFFDYDRDGWLDLYVGNYVDFTYELHRPCTTRAGAPDYCDPKVYAAVPDRLFRNLGTGGDGRVRFEDATAKAGLAAAHGKALGAVAADLDGDGWPDLYVANDGTPNQLWLNQGDGTFREEAMLAGCAVSGEGLSEASMGVDAADLDLDGDLDLVISHLTGETHTVYLNDGRGLFDDRTAAAGLGAVTLRATGFGVGARDFDRDGVPDLLAVNGAVRAVEGLARGGDPYPFHQPNQLFLGVGDGRFEEVTDRAGAAFEPSEVSRGALFGDLDLDGDTDVVVVNNQGPARVLQNVAGDGRPWLGVRVVVGDEGRARDALGATVAVDRPGSPPIWHRAAADGSYAAANDPRVLLHPGDPPPDAVTVRVRWPEGGEELFDGLAPGRYHTLRRGTGRAP